MLTVALLALFTLLCVLLSAEGAWDNETRPERNALVFDGRNREYGAFVLRREYERRFAWAVAGALGLFAAAVAVPKVLAHLGFLATAPVERPLVRVVDREMDPFVIPPKAPEDPRPTEPRRAVSTAPAAPNEPNIVVVPKDSMITPEPRDTATAVPIAPGPGPSGPGTPGPAPTPSGGGGPMDSPLGSANNPRSMAEVAKLPEFVGGQAAMARFIQDNIVFPEEDGLTNQKEWVEFVVDEDGTVLRVRAKGKASKAFSEAAERVVRAMPKWVPAELTDGEKAACLLVLPIDFRTR